MIILGILAAYLIGSIPTAYIFGKVSKGIDIRQHGSGNVGATNAFRVLGKTPGIICLILDILKGMLVIVGVSWIFNLNTNVQLIILSLAVVAGHNWTIFLKFKGGKGIATTLGVLIGLTVKIAAIRPVLLITLASWIISFLISRIVSISSIIAAVVLPISMLLTNQEFELVFLGVVFCIWVVFRHRPNIKRLLSGQETKVDIPFFRSKNT